jgi:hypothetical protein
MVDESAARTPDLYTLKHNITGRGGEPSRCDIPGTMDSWSFREE